MAVVKIKTPPKTQRIRRSLRLVTDQKITMRHLPKAHRQTGSNVKSVVVVVAVVAHAQVVKGVTVEPVVVTSKCPSLN
jgi:hypothetical protein